MNNKQRLILLMTILSVVTALVTGTAIYTLYRAAISQQRERLVDIVERQTSLIETIASWGIQHSKINPDSIEQYTLRHLSNAKYINLGRTGEITIARKVDDRIVFLLERRYEGWKHMQSVPFNSDFAEPSRRALSGRSGTVIGRDYRGVKVLAAYRPIKSLNMSIVAKIDFSEIRTPYIHAGLISAGIASIAIVLGSILFFRVSNPMVLRLVESESKYRQLIETLQEGVWVIDQNANTSFVNPKMADMLGYTMDEMMGKSLFTFMDKRGVKLANAELERRRQGISEQHDFEFIRKDGKQIFTTLETTPIFDNAGHYMGALAGVMDVTDRRRTEEALRSSEEKFRSIIEQSTDGIILTDGKGSVIEWNRGAERFMGLERKDAVGLPLWDVQFKVSPEALRTPEAYEQLKDMLLKFFKSHHAPWINRITETNIQRPDGEHRTVQTLVFPIQIKHGFMAGSIVRDATEAKKAEGRLKSLLQEKDILLKEVYHRVKNNFQIVVSLLNLQSQNIRDPYAQEIFKESRDRVRTMSLIHEKLYQSESLSGIPFGEYIRELVTGLFHSYGADPSKITLMIDAKNVSLGVDTAIPCGLIVNELVSNCLKYAFPKTWTRKGLIEIKLHQDQTGMVHLRVADNGTGMPEGFDIQNTKSLGLHLVSMLAEQQLRGRLELDGKEGTAFTITFR